MKKKHTLLFTLLLILAFSLPVFGATTKTIKKGQKTLTLNVGNQFLLKVKNGKTAKWKARESAVYKITKKGLIKAKKAGTGKLIYTIGDKKYAVKLKVNKPASSSTTRSSSTSGSSGGGGTVYWVDSGEVYHSTSSCPSLSRSRNIHSGPLSSCPKSRPCKNCH